MINSPPPLGYTKPEKPRKAMDIRAAVMRDMGNP
jgi:hypothetical protein